MISLRVGATLAVVPSLAHGARWLPQGQPLRDNGKTGDAEASPVPLFLHQEGPLGLGGADDVQDLRLIFLIKGILAGDGRFVHI